METLGQHLVVSRQKARKTLRSLAAEVHISPALLSLIEHDRHLPDKALIVRLAEALGADPDQWCGLVGQITPSAEESLARLARQEPQFFRTMVNRLGADK